MLDPDRAYGWFVHEGSVQPGGGAAADVEQLDCGFWAHLPNLMAHRLPNTGSDTASAELWRWVFWP